MAMPPRFDKIDYEKGIFWNISSSQNYALLNIISWSNNLLKSIYHQKFKPEIDHFIKELRASEVQNLIIDLRGNQMQEK